MALAKATIVSQFFNQEMYNILWYRSQPDNPPLVDWVAGALALGEWVADNVIRPALGQQRLANITCQGVTYQRVEVMVYNPPPLGSINPVELINAPAVTQVNQLSTPAGQPFAPQAGSLIRLNCAATTLNPLDYTPSGGYIFVGPIMEENVQPNGDIRPEHIQTLSNFGAALLAVGTFGAGIQARPIRVGVSRVGRPAPGVFGWAEVTSVTPRTKVAWRRSRTPE